MIDLADAQAYVRSLAGSLAPVRVAVEEAAGLVLAEVVVAVDDVPSFDNAAVDGFAARMGDGDGPLKVVGVQPAGLDAGLRVGPGEAVRIMTGAPVPPGADRIVMVEHASVVGASVTFEGEGSGGLGIRRAGEDLSRGERVLEPGRLCDPATLGVCVNAGASSLLVVPRPRVGVASTGDELVPPGVPLQRGQVRDSNRPALLAAVVEAGAVAIDLGCWPDDEGAIEAGLRQAVSECDLVLTSGGVSMGDFDFVKSVLRRVAEMRWMQVAIRPAKPLAAGTLSGVPIVGLPGNPVSSLVSFELFARPLIGVLAGSPGRERVRFPVMVPSGIRRRADGKVHFVRVALSREGVDWLAEPVAGQGSHQLSALARSDGLAVVPDGLGVEPGGWVEVIVLGEP